MLDQAVADMGADLLKMRKILAEVWLADYYHTFTSYVLY